MEKKPVLVVMAAGMGSRYGGLKQIDPVGNHGQVIIDYSIYDAKRAGFETVVFVIKHEIEETFKEAIGNRLSKMIHVEYAFQELSDLPDGYQIPEGRVKPWGTAHAIMAARKVVDGPFAVINADDYYGPEGFKAIYKYLSENPDQPDGYAVCLRATQAAQGGALAARIPFDVLERASRRILDMLAGRIPENLINPEVLK